MAGPEIAVVVASHERPLRLRWLLNSLEEQTLARDRFEVIVAHDSRGDDTAVMLREHPLTAAGTLRDVRLDPPEPGVNSASKLRNAGWRTATAPLIAFTDDDCRAPAEWLESALAAARRHPGAIVQGMTLADPDEQALKHGPWWRSQHIVPPVPWAQCCNIVYPRDLLEDVGGLLEDPPLAAGEDTELALRARATGAGYVGAPEALTYHAVEDVSLRERLRSLRRWGDQAYVVKRHPQARADYPMWIFWKRTHVWLPFAVAGAALARRSPLFLGLAVPWVVHAAPRHGESPRSRLRSLSELPGRFLIDATEMAALARGSARHRSLML